MVLNPLKPKLIFLKINLYLKENTTLPIETND